MKKDNRIRNTVVAALCVLSLSPALLFAGGRAKAVEKHATIRSVDVSTHTLLVTEGKKNIEQKFQWNEQTRFTQHGKAVSASDLREGERVDLTYTPGGKPPALQVVRIAKAAKHSASHISPAKST